MNCQPAEWLALLGPAGLGVQPGGSSGMAFVKVQGGRRGVSAKAKVGPIKHAKTNGRIRTKWGWCTVSPVGATAPDSHQVASPR